MMRRVRKRSAYGGFARRSSDTGRLGQRLRLPVLLSEGGLRAFLLVALTGLVTLLYPTAPMDTTFRSSSQYQLGRETSWSDFSDF